MKWSPAPASGAVPLAERVGAQAACVLWELLQSEQPRAGSQPHRRPAPQTHLPSAFISAADPCTRSCPCAPSSDGLLLWSSSCYWCGSQRVPEITSPEPSRSGSLSCCRREGRCGGLGHPLPSWALGRVTPSPLVPQVLTFDADVDLQFSSVFLGISVLDHGGVFLLLLGLLVCISCYSGGGYPEPALQYA